MPSQLRNTNQKSESETSLQDAIREMASVVRRHRLDYQQTAYVLRKARALVGVEKLHIGKRLPKILTDTERDAFFQAIEKGGNTQHELLFRLLYVTGLRVSELTNLRREHLDIPRCTVQVVAGKGDKDRTVLFPETLQLALRLYLDATPNYVFLFETRRRQAMTPRWVQTLAHQYGDQAGITHMHPHRLRHTLLTNLTRAGMTDSQIQLVSGHASKKALEVYQSLALSDVAADYQAAMHRYDVHPGR